MLALQYFDDTFDTNKSEYDFRLLVRMFEVPLFRFKMQQSVTLKARVDELQTTEEAVFELTALLWLASDVARIVARPAAGNAPAQGVLEGVGFRGAPADRAVATREYRLDRPRRVEFPAPGFTVGLPGRPGSTLNAG